MSRLKDVILESVKNLIPRDQVSNVERAINEFVENTRENLKEEYERTLESSYSEWDQQMKSIKESYENKIEEIKEQNEYKLQENIDKAIEGYEQAKLEIQEKDEQLQRQANEFESFLNEQYEIAKNMIEEEKAYNEQLEQNLYEEYMRQIEDMKNDLVEKIDGFLEERVDEITEAVKRELQNSPEILEHKVAFDKIKKIVSSSLSSSEIDDSVSEKIENLEESIKRLKAENKTIKAKNMRLLTESSSKKYRPKSLEDRGIYNKKDKGIYTRDEDFKNRKIDLDEDDDDDNEYNDNDYKDDIDYIKNKNSIYRGDDIERRIQRRLSERNAEEVEGRGSVISEHELITERAVDKRANRNIIMSESDYMRKLAGITK